MIRVFLLDDHRSFRQALGMVIEMQEDMTLASEAGSLAEGRQLLPASEADVCVIDLDLPDGSGVDFLRTVRESGRARSVVLTGSSGQLEWARAVEAGAIGVVNKAADMTDILDAVRRAADGEVLLAADELLELLQAASRAREHDEDARARIARLTKREREVLQLFADGLSNKEIAARLHVSLDTQRSHVANILTKLGLHSQLQAILFAIRHGLVEIR